MPTLFLLSLPPKAAPGGAGEPETRLKSWIEQTIGAPNGVAGIALPDLKIGLLDSLVQQAEDVAKLDGQLQNLVLKTHESIASLFAHDAARTANAELIDGRSAQHYLQQFGWNTAKYRPDRAISAIVASLSQEAFSAEQDLKTQSAAYAATRQQVQALDRKFSGDLSVRALDAVVRPRDLVQNSEFLETVLLAVPIAAERDFLNSYESIATMVVPRSAHKISADAAFVLYGVTVFKKFAREFESRAREAKWLPREAPSAAAPPAANNAAASGSQEGTTPREDEQALRERERRQRTELERLASVAFGDIVKAWGHLKVVRVFVESVLRYGLPANYITATFEPALSPDKTESRLLEQFAHLGGNAVARDSKGRVKADDDLAEFAGLVEQDYKPFVVYSMVLPSIA